MTAEPIGAFIEVARAYCELVENVTALAGPDLLQRAETLLTGLYSAALALPAREPITSEWRTISISHDRWSSVHADLKAALAARDVYREIYDPAAHADPGGAVEGGDDPVFGSLADDFADIWRDLRPGLDMWERADDELRSDLVFEWRASFGFHWGQHLVNALRVVHWWLHVHHLDASDDLRAV